MNNKKVYYVHKNKHIVMNKPLLCRILSISALCIAIILPFHLVQAQTAITIGETNVLTTNDSGNGNLLIAQQATLSQTATIQSLSFYVTTAGGDLRLGIYDATGPGGGPGAKKAETNSFTPTTGWNTANVITPVSLPTGTYWLTYLPSSSSLGFRLAYTGSAKWYSYTYGVMPTTYSTAPTAGTYHWSFYATLNTSTSPDTTAPTTPTNLSATAVSSSQINLSWTASTDNVGVTGYDIYRNGTLLTSVTTPSYSNTGLTASTLYSYTVRAKDAAGKISPPQTTGASATTLAGTPPPSGTAITSVDVTNTSGTTLTNIPVTFAQPFKVGDVPVSATLYARTSSGVALNLQVDKKASNADGSLRHAIFTTRLPSLAPNGSEKIILSASTGGISNAPVSSTDVLNTSYDATVTLTLGGTVYTASARTLLQANPTKKWIEGYEATEWILSSPLKTASGVAHPHLTARFNVRAYKGMDAIQTDVVIENDWAYEPGPQNFTYDVSVNIPGKGIVYSKSALTHYHHARWHKTFWWGTEPTIRIAHDSAYLIATGAVPNYDQSVKVPSVALSNTASQWTGAITQPMGSGFLEQYMGTPGSRWEIGPLPQWTAQYILSMDPGVKTATLGNGDVAGSWPVHYRDKVTDLPVSLIDHPNMTILADGHGFDDFPACSNCGTPTTPDSAHQPSLAYVPYLVTGDYYYLEELQFWADWNIFRSNPDYRGGNQGLVNWEEVRGQSWSLRTLAQTAYITPDSSAMKKYFVDRTNYNISWYVNAYPNNSSAPALGFLTSGFAIRNNRSEEHT